MKNSWDSRKNRISKRISNRYKRVLLKKVSPFSLKTKKNAIFLFFIFLTEDVFTLFRGWEKYLFFKEKKKKT